MADNLLIQISALLAKNTESELQNQLDKIAKKLKLTIKDVQVANQNITKTSTSTNTVATTTDKATQSLSRYAKGIENLIHLYKMKLRTDDQFLKSMEQMRSTVEFTML